MRIEATVAAAGGLPPLCYVPADGIAPQVTVVTYGGMTEPVEQALLELACEEEIFCDYFVLTQLWPLEADPLAASVQRTGRLVVVEEGVPDFGLGAAVIARLAQRGALAFRSAAVGARPEVIPCAAHLEAAVLPGEADVRAAILNVCDGAGETACQNMMMSN
jgi:pyruvate dehydrogenase E1 component beta subunit